MKIWWIVYNILYNLICNARSIVFSPNYHHITRRNSVSRAIKQVTANLDLLITSIITWEITCSVTIARAPRFIKIIIRLFKLAPLLLYPSVVIHRGRFSQFITHKNIPRDNLKFGCSSMNCYYRVEDNHASSSSNQRNSLSLYMEWRTLDSMSVTNLCNTKARCMKHVWAYNYNSFNINFSTR